MTKFEFFDCIFSNDCHDFSLRRKHFKINVHIYNQNLDHGLIRLAAWNSSLDSDYADSAACNTAWYSSYLIFGKTNWSDASNAAWDLSFSTAVISATLTGESAAREGRLPIEIGRTIYRTVEKICLLIFLKNFEEIFNKFYDSFEGKTIDVPNEKIFLSFERWEWFKSRIFNQIQDDTLHFLSPWIIKLDQIAAKIDGAQEFKFNNPAAKSR